MTRLSRSREPMRVLVTGCAGFIGSHLSERLLELGHEVVGADCFTSYYARDLKVRNLDRVRGDPAFELRERDLSQEPLDGLLDGVQVVFHLAAQPGVRRELRRLVRRLRPPQRPRDPAVARGRRRVPRQTIRLRLILIGLRRCCSLSHDGALSAPAAVALRDDEARDGGAQRRLRPYPRRPRGGPSLLHRLRAEATSGHGLRALPRRRPCAAARSG